MSVVFVELFAACLKELHDEEYCRGVVEAVAELAASRQVAYRGRRGVTYVLNLPRGDQPTGVDSRRSKKEGADAHARRRRLHDVSDV
jgi:hypothetical protein